LFWLLAYFSLASFALALVFVPRARALLGNGWRRCLQATARVGRGGQQAAHGASAVGASAADVGKRGWDWVVAHKRLVMYSLPLLVLVPAAAVWWRSATGVSMFDHTDMRVPDERVAALLAGERLVPPAPLPPDVFTTREVEQVRPAVRFASRDWALLDQEFAQRLLMVFRIMKEQHGYDMVLLEGYRSPQRQAQLAAQGGHVTRAGAFRSYHQFGLAADSAFMRDGKLVISERDPWAMRGYELYGQVSASLGLTWGGAWRSIKDYGHVELRRPGVLKAAGAAASEYGE
jgi:peptidoglycan L-alanyl-D-glutamate endopeptidase CwlK